MLYLSLSSCNFVFFACNTVAGIRDCYYSFAGNSLCPDILQKVKSFVLELNGIINLSGQREVAVSQTFITSR